MHRYFDSTSNFRIKRIDTCAQHTAILDFTCL